MYLLNSKKITQLVLATLFVAIASFSVTAQKKKATAHSEPKKPVIISEATGSNNESGKSTASAKSSNIFVQSLRDQLAVREREVAVAKETLEKTKQLFADGIVSKRTVEEAEVAFVEAQAKADDVRRKLSAYEGTSTETNTTTTAENKIEEEAKKDDVVMTTAENTEKKSTVKRTSQTKAKKPLKKGKGKN